MGTMFAIVVLITGLAAPDGTMNANSAADLVLSEVLGQNISGKSVMVLDRIIPEGTAVESWHDTVTAPLDGYLVLIDDFACANWEHPCRWVFVGLDGEMQIINMMTPPNALGAMTVTHTCLPQSDGRGQYEDFIAWFVPNVQSTSANAEHMYAWIISGGFDNYNNHIRYYGDVQFIYNVLAHDYLLPDDHIVVCFADGLNPAPDQSGGLNSNPDFDDDGDSDIIYDATSAGITSGFNDIYAMVGSSDHLFIFTTDHGGPGKGGTDTPPEVILNLWNGTLDDDTFKGYIDSISSASTHVIMEQCYSGGFLEEVVNTGATQPRTFASAANATESSWAGATFPEYDEYCYYWTGAMHGSIPPTTSVSGGNLPGNPDQNSDGKVSFWEAYDRAKAWDSYAVSGQEHPLWDDTPNNCGDTYYLGGLISTSTGDSRNTSVPSAVGLSVSGNPVSSVSTVLFGLSSSGAVDIVIYDMSGHVVDNLLSDELAAGQHSVIWDTEKLASGVYIVRFTAGEIMETARAVKF